MWRSTGNRQERQIPRNTRFGNRNSNEFHRSRQQTDNAGNFSTNRFNRNENPGHSASNERRSSNISSNLPDRYNGKKFVMGFKYVESLIQNQDLEHVVTTLNNDKKGFKVLLDTRDMTNDLIVITIKLISKICASEFLESKIRILQMALSSKLVENLWKFISGVAVQGVKEKMRNKHFWNDTDEFWCNVITICKTTQNLIPLTSCETTIRIIKGLKLYIPAIEESHFIHISDEIKTDVDNLFKVIERSTQELERKIAQKEVIQEVELEPPEDFREISIYPTTREVTTNDSPFLRPNIVQGPYRDVEHYLDIQYRLLREDFVSPLRKGICNYMSKSKERLEDVKIHNPIRFLNSETINDQACYRIQYDFRQKIKKINYETSKNFMFGSLLCFTSDNFKTILFGRIAQRDVKDLEAGQLIVGFDEGTRLPGNLFQTNYVMVESKVYFEPYYHVLSALKVIDIARFPMEKFIIRVETKANPPDYLISEPTPVVYKMSDELAFSPLNMDPEQKFFDLNEAQLEAFKAAITEEFVVIQGPPGTGKTFLGLKIAETLLRNQSVWYTCTPMLVICYTNHALDQFLEGILGVTDNLLRVGSRSKNEKLNEYNIRHNRHIFSEDLFHYQHEVKENLTRIRTINESLKQIEAYHGVIHFSAFHGVVVNFRNSWFSKHTNRDIINWLFNKPQTFDSHRLPDEQMQVHNISDDESIDDITEDLNNEFFDDTFDDIEINSYNYIIDIKSLRSRIALFEQQLRLLQANTDLDPEVRFEQEYIQYELYSARKDCRQLEQKLGEGANGQYLDEPRNVNLQNPYFMNPKSRWHLYFYWLNLYKENLLQRKQDINTEFRKVYRYYNELREIEDTRIMKEALVVGMTTTSAARLKSAIRALKSPIVIVEEAAEVLESHIVCSLTDSCKHLILIGDHQQLKPSTSDFKIETKYLLGISLFERMVKNNITCHRLNVQHRMRPEISCLIRPSIYPVLEDHTSVFNRLPIRGIDNCIYFIDHQEMEEQCNDMSKKNIHEAKFLISLAKHLILNGYKPEDITIVATYLGQMFEMQCLKKQNALLKDVRITVLDNYQGEESNIILLSLVRSNGENKIGFLKIENRVCVALSRARNGFYMMGNMAHLRGNSELWAKVNESLEKQNAIGPSLKLRCQVHPLKITEVKTSEDFLGIAEGGCNSKCGSYLRCGHYCTRLCHIRDRDHNALSCLEQCTKILCNNEQHKCKKLCYEDCGPCNYLVEHTLDCGHTVQIECHEDPAKHNCKVPVESTLPCGHEANKPCYRDPKTFPCPHPCEVRVEPCGHACTRNCHINADPDHLEYKCLKPCARPRTDCSLPDGEKHICPDLCCEECSECTVMIKKVRNCSHAVDIACNIDVNETKCEKPCRLNLLCGHKCKQKCHEPCGPCNVQVEKTVPGCYHTVKVKCCEEPDRKFCKEKCPRPLSCGHKCDKLCCEPCTTFCQVTVDCSIKGPCGHTIKQVKCALKYSADSKTLLQYCTEKCNVTLKCGHVCMGSCGECLQGRIHQRCKQNCNNILICNHECQTLCNQACKPCTKECRYKCSHSKCSRQCGDPCIKCMEPCVRQCEHQKCRRRCSDICGIPPCDKNCEKLLPCGHPCVGFCGDPCPELCRVCHKDELTDIFFGNEDEEDARFVTLNDCKHVLESEGLEAWFRSNDKEIVVMSCPRCKTPITSTERYSHFIKKNMMDITNVKRRSTGTDIENKLRGIAMSNDLDILTKKSALLCKYSPQLSNTLVTFKTSLQHTIKKNGQQIRQTMNKMDLDAMECKFRIIESIIEIFYERGNPLGGSGTLMATQLSIILETLTRARYHITQQEIQDLTLETDRLLRMFQLEQIKAHRNFDSFKNNSTIIDKLKIVENLLSSFERYGKNTDDILQLELTDINKLMSSTVNISTKEKKEIVAALGLSKGHWFKCPNGHLYIITECGGAMEISTCNECGERIGGQRHTLLPGQRLASEMDGSSVPAWSEAANMANYGIRF